MIFMFIDVHVIGFHFIIFHLIHHHHGHQHYNHHKKNIYILFLLLLVFIFIYIQGSQTAAREPHFKLYYQGAWPPLIYIYICYE